MKRPPPRLSLDLLRAFCAAATHLSFTRAARDQFVTQSAISHAIHTLEKQLGQPLFCRVNRALKLTHAGEALYRACSEALELIDSAAGRLVGSRHSLGVTTTAALASLWLVPKLPQFAGLHPGTDVRIVATNDRIDLEREHLDLAIHFTLLNEVAPHGDRLVEYLQFPVCSPMLARSRKVPLRTPADLAHHVRLDFETIVYGRPWYDWEKWLGATKLPSIVPAGTMRFSHYDQVIQAAMEGSGVAIGKWPHLAQHLQEGLLCVPFGRDWIAHVGGFNLVVARGAETSDAVQSFVAWLRDELRRDALRTSKLLPLMQPPSPQAGRGLMIKSSQ